MGGKCQLCSYDKCNRALSLHHIDPSEKDFNFGKIIANPKKFDDVVAELKKCILLCMNCHAEVHDNIDAFNFKSSFSQDRLDEVVRENTYIVILDNCPICGKQKSIKLSTCSRSCAAKKARTVDWDKHNVVEMLIDTNGNFCEVGRLLGITDNGVRKRFQKVTGFKNWKKFIGP